MAIWEKKWNAGGKNEEEERGKGGDGIKNGVRCLKIACTKYTPEFY